MAEGEPLPSHDLRCPMLSLPLAFGTALATIPNRVPYIAAAPARIAKWQSLLPANGKVRVGLVWAGNPKHRNNRNRSIALERLLPLMAVECVDWIGLQTEIGGPDRAVLDAHPQIVNIGDKLADFSDTAAVMASLDLVLTVDTAAAHLAGAMAKPVWVVLPFSPDWRWMLDRPDSPWYPTARLFRQPAPGDWDSVIAELMRELPVIADQAGVAARRAGLIASDRALAFPNSNHTERSGPWSRPVEEGSAPTPKFPENREFNREFFRFRPDSNDSASDRR